MNKNDKGAFNKERKPFSWKRLGFIVLKALSYLAVFFVGFGISACAFFGSGAEESADSSSEEGRSLRIAQADSSATNPISGTLAQVFPDGWYTGRPSASQQYLSVEGYLSLGQSGALNWSADLDGMVWATNKPNAPEISLDMPAGALAWLWVYVSAGTSGIVDLGIGWFDNPNDDWQVSSFYATTREPGSMPTPFLAYGIAFSGGVSTYNRTPARLPVLTPYNVVIPEGLGGFSAVSPAGSSVTRTLSFMGWSNSTSGPEGPTDIFYNPSLTLVAEPVGDLSASGWFQDGYNTGYNQGYGTGFQDGGKAATSAPAGVAAAFAIVGDAFSAVGDFLSVQVLPGISVGLLLGIPILGALVAWLVKLLRGD